MAWWKTAKPGDKVVCVETAAFDGCKLSISKGSIYTISEVYCGPVIHYVTDEFIDAVGLRLVEKGGWHVFDVAHFRPVQENKKSTEAGVAALRRHLVGKTVEAV